MKKIYTVDSWVMFILILLPVIFPQDIFGFILTFAYAFSLLAWGYFLGVNLYSKLPDGHTLNLKKFKFFIFFPAVYFTIAIIASGGGGYSINSSNIEEFGPIAYLIIPLHLFSMFCIFYCMYFISKSLVCVLTQNKNTSTSEYIGYFIGLWFFPIGVWFIQPKIKRIFTNGKQAQMD